MGARASYNQSERFRRRRNVKAANRRGEENVAPETTVTVLEIDRDWATIWLNRPEARNAMSDELVAELQALLDYLAPRTDIRGITVRGKGEVYCAGGDLKGFKNNFQNVRTDEEVIADSSKIGHVFLKIRAMPQVVVFLVHGAAMAGGLGMAASADIVIATRDTRMALTETAIGIVPAQIGRYIVARTGDIKARRIMLTGHRFTAVEGKDYGRRYSHRYVCRGGRIGRDCRRCAPLCAAGQCGDQEIAGSQQNAR